MRRGRHNVRARGPRVLGTVLRLAGRVVVLIIGFALILASLALGWLPGPGGIPLFLTGIAVLSTQFAWARRVRSWLSARVRQIARTARDGVVDETDDDQDGRLVRQD